MDQDKKNIIDRISNGEIENWVQVEVESNIIGFETDSEMVLALLTSQAFTDCIVEKRKNICNMLENSIKTDDIMDRFFEDSRVTSKMIEIDRVRLGLCWHQSFEDYTDSFFDSLRLLRLIDIRNPRYMLKFFLKSDVYHLNPYSYYYLLCDIINRTQKRRDYYYLNHNEYMFNKFDDFLNRLKYKKDEFFAKNRMMF